MSADIKSASSALAPDQDMQMEWRNRIRYCIFTSFWQAYSLPFGKHWDHNCVFERTVDSLRSPFHQKGVTKVTHLAKSGAYEGPKASPNTPRLNKVTSGCVWTRFGTLSGALP